MARKLRIEYAGAVYHAMARGNQGESDFPRQPGPELGAVEGQTEPIGIRTTVNAEIIGPLHKQQTNFTRQFKEFWSHCPTQRPPAPGRPSDLRQND
jgi:hypothetical protein